MGYIQALKISIHALREEGDRKQIDEDKEIYEFLSTPSARRATPLLRCQTQPAYISIHALREEGDSTLPGSALGVGLISIHALREEGDPERFFFIPKQLLISIHALREEGDLEGDSYLTLSVIFLSTPSARRATL